MSHFHQQLILWLVLLRLATAVATLLRATWLNSKLLRGLSCFGQVDYTEGNVKTLLLRLRFELHHNWYKSIKWRQGNVSLLWLLPLYGGLYCTSSSRSYCTAGTNDADLYAFAFHVYRKEWECKYSFPTFIFQSTPNPQGLYGKRFEYTLFAV